MTISLSTVLLLWLFLLVGLLFGLRMGHLKYATDAARWRALVGSARIRVHGSSGIYRPTRAPSGYAHVGLDLWTLHDAPERKEGADVLTRYADIARGAHEDCPSGEAQT